MKRLLSLLAITLLLAGAACSEKKLPEQSVVQGKKVLSALRNLGKAYEKKNLTFFMDNVEPRFHEREALSKALANVFLKNESVRLNIQYTNMIILVEAKGMIKATFNWDGEWLAAAGMTQKNSGRATLGFDPGNFKLMSIDGKDPFAQLPGELPGKQ